MMNCTGFPTEVEIANERRRQFRMAIEKKAADLARSKRNQALKVAIASAQPLPPEAVPAEPDPPPCCPYCAALRAAPPASASKRSYPAVVDIQKVVASFYNVTRGDLCSDRRMAEVVRPRQIAMYIAKEITPLSLPALGQRFGGRDHTTVLHAVRKISGLVYADASFALEVVTLMGGLQIAEPG